MNQQQVALIKDSWNFVVADVPSAGLLFYNKLFEMDPSLRQLFHTDIQKQAQKLFSMISYVVNRLDKIEEIIEEVKALGARHKNYHVQKEHYATVGQALIWTLEQGLGDKWNEDLKAAWLEAYTVLANTMIEASEAA